jgi:hypothetical protein
VVDFHVEPEVGIYIVCCGVWELLILTFVSLFGYRRSVFVEMGCELWLRPEVHPPAPATTIRCSVKMPRPMIKVMVLRAKATMLLTMVAKTLLLLMLMCEAVRCDWVVIFGIVIRISLT